MDHGATATARGHVVVQVNDLLLQEVRSFHGPNTGYIRGYI